MESYGGRLMRSYGLKTKLTLTSFPDKLRNLTEYMKKPLAFP